MIFEVGKYYQHASGEKMAIVGEVNTTLYGDNVLVGEPDSTPNLRPVGRDESNTVNWKEISKEEWMKSFSK